MGVLAMRILQSFIVFGHPTPMRLSRRKPSRSRYESRSPPPMRLMIWIWSRLVEPRSLSTAETAISAKCSLSAESTFEESVVLAMLMRSSRKAAASAEWSTAEALSALSAASRASLNPATTVCGCIFFSMSSAPCLRSSPARTQTEVVPSPTSSSCTFEMSMSTLAAGLSISTLLRMVAPSLVTETMLPRPTDCRILSMPFGPKLVLTRSDTARAPMMEDMRACSPLLSCASASKMLTGAIFGPIIFTAVKGV
mmetsp:Transcript_50420/g.109283  ORF Transcript_50420/g.109283 Transcript_50420/m.109283 type:complete len:253 (-) Transcript_50420:245-1003(-)